MQSFDCVIMFIFISSGDPPIFWLVCPLSVGAGAGVYRAADMGQGRPGGHMHSGGPAERRVRQRRAASLISYHHNMPTLYQ